MSKYFDIFAYLMGKKAGSGGGGDITVESKSIDANGTYTAPAGKAYSPVTVNVPNSYAAGDEGKVVSNGALVAQGSDSVTQNGTVDTTLINSLTVNVSGGGGSNWTLLASEEFEVNTSSTTQTSIGSVELPGNNYGKEDIIWVHIRDKAGKRTGYWYGSDSILINFIRVNPASQAQMAVFPFAIEYVQSSGAYNLSSSAYGLTVEKMTQADTDHKVYIRAKYGSSFGTINGTYKVDVYKLTPASGMTMFDT